MFDAAKWLAEEYKKKMRPQVRQAFIKVANTVNNEMFMEANIMFDSFIQQFYGSYAPRVYVRHGTFFPGEMGSNLYNGKQFKRVGGYDPKLIIDFSGVDMDSSNYGVSADDVLDLVNRGVRFPSTSKTSGLYWSGEYHSSLTKMTYTGTIQDAFEIFTNNFDDIVAPVFWEEWERAGWKRPKGC